MKIQNLIIKLLFFLIIFSCEYEKYDSISDKKPLAECIDGFARFELNGEAYEYECSGYDLMGYVSLEEMDAISGNDCWGWTDSATGKEYALMGLDNGTAFIDISDPIEPIYLGKLPTETISTIWRDIKVFEDHAFVVADFNAQTSEDERMHGIQVIDLNILSGISNPQTFNIDYLYLDHGKAHNIVINEDSGFAYSVGSNTFGGGIHVVNISNPKNPVFVSGFADEGYSHDAQVVTYNGPDNDYKGKEIFFGSNESKIVIIDVSDKDNIKTISTLEYSNSVPGYTHQNWLTENHQYLLVGDELDEIKNIVQNTRTIVLDISDLDNPVVHTEFLNETDAIDHNGYVFNDEFFLASYTSGMRVIDILNINQKTLEEIGFFDTYNELKNDQYNNTLNYKISSFDDDHGNPSKGRLPEFNGAWSVYPFFKSENILISDINSGLFIVKKSN